MRTMVGAALGVVMLFAAPGGSWAADDPAAILDKAIKAHGGADKLAKNKAMQWDAKGTLTLGEMKVPYSCTCYFQQPNQFRFNMNAEFAGQKLEVAVGTDGKVAWESAMDMVQEMDEKKMAAFHHNIYCIWLAQLVPLKDKEFQLTAAGEAKVNDKPAVGIKVSRKGHADVTLFFDKESGLLVKSETTIWDEFTGGEAKQESFYKNYKDVGGVQKLCKIVIHRDGKLLLEEEFSNHKVMEKIDAKTFAKP